MRCLIWIACGWWLLVGSVQATDKEPAIGYLGFLKNKPWAIQFNDCTVYRYVNAQKYLWFDRKLQKISCYHFYRNLEGRSINKSYPRSRLMTKKIKIFPKRMRSSTFKTISQFKEFAVDETGWGTFPKVYEVFGVGTSRWYRVQEGWLQLDETDRKFVRYYAGEPDAALKAKHHQYYHSQ